MAEKMPIYGTDTTGYFRPMTLDEVRHLTAGQKIWIRYKQHAKLEEARKIEVIADTRTFIDATRIEIRVLVGPTRVTLRAGEVFGGMLLVRQRFILEDAKD